MAAYRKIIEEFGEGMCVSSYRPKFWHILSHNAH